MDETFTSTSNALCLPRSECEEMCKSLDDCESFDMHRTLPRCWLNSGDYCNPGRNPYQTPTESLHNINSGIYEASEDLEFVYMGSGLEQYVTVEGKECTNSGDMMDVTGSPLSCDIRCSGPVISGTDILNHLENSYAYGYDESGATPPDWSSFNLRDAYVGFNEFGVDSGIPQSQPSFQSAFL